MRVVQSEGVARHVILSLLVLPALVDSSDCSPSNCASDRISLRLRRRGKNRSFFGRGRGGVSKILTPPNFKFECGGKSIASTIVFAIFCKTKKCSHCGLAGDGHPCDKKYSMRSRHKEANFQSNGESIIYDMLAKMRGSMSRFTRTTG